MERLGYTITPVKLDVVYKKFIAVADKKKDLNDDDLRMLMGDHAESKGASLQSIEVTSGIPQIPKAEVMLLVDGKKKIATATGDGPIDASFQAINKILKKKVILAEYLVQAMTGGSDDMGKVHVQVEHDSVVYYGFGADTDIIVASVKAYLDALNKT